MGVLFFVDIDSTDATTYLEDVKSRQKHLKPAFEEAGNIMRRSFATNFLEGGRPKWAPLSSGTIADKKNKLRLQVAGLRGRARMSKLQAIVLSLKNNTNSILIDSGRLRTSYITKGGEHVETANDDGLTTGSSDPIAPFHEFGTGVHGSSGQPFEIRPRHVGSLRFRGPNGKMIYAKSVMNPGVPARPVAIIQDEDSDRVVQVLLDHILEGAP